jgi:hypothetical protein
MLGAFEQAWLLLKAVFQPSEGYLLDEGMNQMVFGREGDPDVTKVGGVFTLPDMYYLNRLAVERPDLFVSQNPIAQTMELPMDAQARFNERIPVLSQQVRGIPLQYEGTKRAGKLRGDRLAEALYDSQGGELLEALGLSDVKPANWMQTIPQRGIPVSEITGDPSQQGRAVMMDPMFYGPANPSPEVDFARFLAAMGARKVPRRLGIDYQLPEEQKESFARRVDELPFEQFIEPVLESEIPMSRAQEDLLFDSLLDQEDDVKSTLGQIGVV